MSSSVPTGRLFRCGWVLLAATLATTGCEAGADAGGTLGQALGRATEEERFTILLCQLRDPQYHVRNARRYKEVLTRQLGWKGVFVVHKAGHSEVFWGRYRTVDDAQKNLRTAKAYRTRNGLPIFAKALVVPLPGRQVGPPQWDLRNAPGMYSLLVAVFRDEPERNYIGRERFAVAYCRKLRQSGYEAYYYHDRALSHVTIGSFGPEDVTIRRRDQREVLEILNPRIKQLRRDFPDLAVNGVGVADITYDPVTGRRTRRVMKTYLIRIPKGKGGEYGG